MGSLIDYAPIVAAAFAVPQFLPQLLKVRGTGDTAGVSWSWATLTSVNNAAWFAYFALSGYWTALVPSSAATLLAGVLAAMLVRRGLARARPAALIGGWVALLVAGLAVAGRGGLGTLLTAAFVLQVTPSVWTAYRTARPTGVSRGTWMLILGELSCWTVFGVHQSDPRLLTLGVTGITASVLMLARIRHASGPWRRRRRRDPDPAGPGGPGHRGGGVLDRRQRAVGGAGPRPQLPKLGRSAQQHGHRCIPMLLERMARGELKTSHLLTHPTVQEQEGGLRPGGVPAGRVSYPASPATRASTRPRAIRPSGSRVGLKIAMSRPMAWPPVTAARSTAASSSGLRPPGRR